MAIWERSIRPTLYDYGGQALVCSNAAGKDLDNFFYNICTDPRHGFHEHHATTMDNPLLPKRLADESEEDKSRAFGSATRMATEKTTSSTLSATASPSLLEIAKDFS